MGVGYIVKVRTQQQQQKQAWYIQEVKGIRGIRKKFKRTLILPHFHDFSSIMYINVKQLYCKTLLKLKCFI